MLTDFSGVIQICNTVSLFYVAGMNAKTAAEGLSAELVFRSIVVSYYLKYVILSRYFDASQQER